jgi:hypothetical protein
VQNRPSFPTAVRPILTAKCFRFKSHAHQVLHQHCDSQVSVGIACRRHRNRCFLQPSLCLKYAITVITYTGAPSNTALPPIAHTLATAKKQDPAEAERLERERVKEEIIFKSACFFCLAVSNSRVQDAPVLRATLTRSRSILSDSMREIAKAADGVSKAVAATKVELQTLRAQSQEMQV